MFELWQKMLEIWLGCFLLPVALLSNCMGAFVGINIGSDIPNQQSGEDVVAILKAHQITHVRLFNADAGLLTALADTGIEVMVGVTNEEILGLGASPSVAAAWISTNVAAYFPSTNITGIAVGNEVLISAPNVSSVLVPAMNYLHKALVASNLNSQIKVSTPQSMDLIPRPFPPSTATFNSSWNSTVVGILQFLKNTNSYYMLKAYPYYGYIDGSGIFPLQYALFQLLKPSDQIVDPNTLFSYDNMFDAMVDAAYNSIAALNFSAIPIVVAESGWPWFGGTKEPYATVTNAENYNHNLVWHVLNGIGPPSQPNIPVNTYIYELFCEDETTGPVSERKWGVFFSNGSSVYSLSLSTSDEASTNFSAGFCVARQGADPTELQNGLNWACGQGQVNCSAIQPGQPCYFPNNLQSHASYAYNDYYQRMHSYGGTCNFSGTAVIAIADPSYGSCRYIGSSNSNTSPPSSTFGPGSSASVGEVPCVGPLVLAFVLSIVRRDVIYL